MNDTNAPLDLDLASVDVSLPLLKDNEIYDLRVEKAEIKQTAAGQDMIHVDMVTTNPAKDMKGNDLGPGIHVFDNLMCVKSGKSTDEMVVRNIASLVQAAGLQGLKQYGATPVEQCKNARNWAPQLQGRVVRAKIGYAPEGMSKTGKAFKAKNEVLLYLKP